MHKYIPARCPLNKPKSFFVIEPLDLALLFTHYPQTPFLQLQHATNCLNVGHYTGKVCGVNFKRRTQINFPERLKEFSYRALFSLSARGPMKFMVQGNSGNQHTVAVAVKAVATLDGVMIRS